MFYLNLTCNLTNSKSVYVAQTVCILVRRFMLII